MSVEKGSNSEFANSQEIKEARARLKNAYIKECEPTLRIMYRVYNNALKEGDWEFAQQQLVATFDRCFEFFQKSRLDRMLVFPKFDLIEDLFTWFGITLEMKDYLPISQYIHAMLAKEIKKSPINNPLSNPADKAHLN